MEPFKFKEVEIKREGSRIERLVKSAHFKRTLIYSIGGAVIGYLLYFLIDGIQDGVFWNDEALQMMISGLAVGIFLTNSPCARGRC